MLIVWPIMGILAALTVRIFVKKKNIDKNIYIVAFIAATLGSIISLLGMLVYIKYVNHLSLSSHIILKQMVGMAIYTITFPLALYISKKIF